MIIRYIEKCHACGQLDPWRKVSTRTVKGVKTTYVKCRRCGAKETVKYVDRPTNAPQWGTISSISAPIGHNLT